MTNLPAIDTAEETRQRVNVELITTRNELIDLADQWNDLLTESQANSIFLTWEWLSTWLEAVYPEAPLLVAAAYDENHQLVGIAPFYVCSMRAMNVVSLKCLRILGECQAGAEYGDLIVHPRCEKAVIEAIATRLLEARNQWDCMYVTSVADWTGGRDRWKQLFAKLNAYEMWQPIEYSAITLPDTHEEYLKSLTGKARRGTARFARRLSEVGTLDYRLCQTQEALPKDLSTLYDLHRCRWQELGQEGSFARRPKLVEFNNKFSPVALERGWLRLYTLDVAGKSAASVYSLMYNGKGYGLQCGFDPAVDGAGRVLWGELIRQTIEEGATEYDFLGGGYKYKRYLGGDSRTGYTIFAGRRSLKTRCVFQLGLWPNGRCIQQGPPETFGCGHD